MEVAKQKNHFVLVHGACHGAWCWYKLKHLLESYGYMVTAVDLASSGISMTKLHDLRTMDEYNVPLIEIIAAVPQGEKVILVGHSLGGINMALAMEKYQEKISVAVFVTAFMPDIVHKPSYVIDQLLERKSPEFWEDTQFGSFGSSEEPLTSMFFGPKFLASRLYQQSPMEDLTLATMLTRPSSLFLEDLAREHRLSSECYESVTRVYVVCHEDNIITEEYQRWMIKESGAKEVKEIMGADHMAMFSKALELCHCLLQIANKHT